MLYDTYLTVSLNLMVDISQTAAGDKASIYNKLLDTQN